jgi:short-subunit dehydrogenase
VTRVDGTVLITGATGGIGHAIARAFAREGATLLLTGRRAAVLEPLAAEVGGQAIACDLADRAQVAELIERASDVDVAVNNAALPASGPLVSFSTEELDRALDVNLRAPMLLARALAARMTARGSGHIVFISSVAGKLASPGSGVYSATKFGLRGLASGLRQDLHGSGVGVSTILPGFISDAGMYADTGVKLPPGIGTSTPEEVADAVLRAIRRNRPEIVVAPRSMRLGAALGGLAPAIAERVQRATGAEKVSGQMHAAQLDKR